MEKNLSRACGNWVEGDKFWDRECETRMFIEYLDDGAHILLTAQRRMGKTSLMREVSRKIKDRYICLWVDLQDAETEADAIAAIAASAHDYQSIWSKVKGVFANFLQGVSEKVDELEVSEVRIKMRGGLSKGDWREKGDKIWAILAQAEKPVVIFCDEVPVLVNRILKDNDYRLTSERIRDAEIFLSWLRQNCLRYVGKIRLVFSGSIGIEPILQQAKLSATINHFQPLELKPWDDKTAIECLRALGNNYGLQYQEGVCELMVAKLGCCIPHHVQMYFDYIHEQCQRSGHNECDRDMAEKVFKESMLSSRGHAELCTYEERLKMVIGKDLLPFALDLLNEAAVVGCLTVEATGLYSREHQDRFGGREANEVLKEVLGVLEHDGYLRWTERGHVFVSALLQEWWKRHNGAYFVPLSQRGGR